MTAKTAGVVSPTHFLKFTFSVEEDELLAVVCLLHAGQGTPKTIPDFVSLATKFAEKKKDEKFSHCFEHIFIKRHSSALCLKTGIPTSPTRSFETMQQKTEEITMSLNSMFSSMSSTKTTSLFLMRLWLGTVVLLSKALVNRESLMEETSMCAERVSQLSAPKSNFCFFTVPRRFMFSS